MSPKRANQSSDRNRQAVRGKIEANTYLPRLAEGYVLGELDLEDLLAYFSRFAHLYTIGIDVNAVCNLSCQYCYLDAYNRTTVPRYAPLEDFFKFVCEANVEGVELVAIVGKEPFADDRGIRMLQFLDALSNHGKLFRYGVVTNGTLINRYIDSLPRSISYVDISLDGPAEVNDSFRGNGVFKRAIANARSLVDSGFDVWISGVLHRGSLKPGNLSDFLRVVLAESGCQRFYFSPIRNFTGHLGELLLSFDEIAKLQEILATASEIITGCDKVILDHPYEGVWRDYFWPLRDGSPSKLKSIRIDRFGNLLDKIGERCYRKLDIFPHGPWATCRVDARGEYLPDVESRTFREPESVGSITSTSLSALRTRALSLHLRPMVERFMRHMSIARKIDQREKALGSVSIPLWVASSALNSDTLAASRQQTLQPILDI